jgi:hypothetical protein
LQNPSADIGEQGVNALMVTLNRCARPMQLQKARQNLHRHNGHDRLLLLKGTAYSHRLSNLADALQNPINFPVSGNILQAPKLSFSRPLAAGYYLVERMG